MKCDNDDHLGLFCCVYVCIMCVCVRWCVCDVCVMCGVYVCTKN